ncbi:uncharacterized protein LOC128885253 [Hylaeus anthracinus]|uniref:uncharacterized protein LOC128885253 n=1 Tax=Hylaeus anthracinus TaxID=313031 RepID=UPI0023B92DE0|nr:uncharacterized protein LOC128885253 [Hylaeus anthracinus]
MPTKSQRSAPLGFIGTISNVLFGTLTEDDAKYYNQEIDKIYKDQKHLSELLGKQTHIVRSEFQDIHQDLIKLRNSSLIMDNKIKQLTAGLLKLDEVETEMELQRASTSWTYQISRQMDEYLQALLILTDATMFAKLGMLHPAILSPDELELTCTRINQSTPYEFLLSLTELRSERFYRIIIISTIYSNGRMLISIEIPLLDKAPFNLYWLHPLPSFLPISHNISSAMLIVPQTPYLAIDDTHKEYLLPTESFIQGCKIHPTKYICQLTLPLYSLEEAPICETDLFIQKRIIGWKNCHIRSLKSTGIFIN